MDRVSLTKLDETRVFDISIVMSNYKKKSRLRDRPAM